MYFTRCLSTLKALEILRFSVLLLYFASTIPIIYIYGIVGRSCILLDAREAVALAITVFQRPLHCTVSGEVVAVRYLGHLGAVYTYAWRCMNMQRIGGGGGSPFSTCEKIGFLLLGKIYRQMNKHADGSESLRFACSRLIVLSPMYGKKVKNRPSRAVGVNFIASEGAFHSLHDQRLDGLPWLLNQ